LNPQASNWLIRTKKDELFLTVLTFEPGTLNPELFSHRIYDLIKQKKGVTQIYVTPVETMLLR
jgi:hypothetical protein